MLCVKIFKFTKKYQKQQWDDVGLLQAVLAGVHEELDGHGNVLRQSPDLVLVLQEVHHVLDQDADVARYLFLIPDLNLGDVKGDVILNLGVVFLDENSFTDHYNFLPIYLLTSR